MLRLAIVVATVIFMARARSQIVAVITTLETNRVAVGTSTRLHVYAQIIPDKRPSTDRIFSWYVDLLNSNGAVAGADYARLQKNASDQDPATSSTGTTTGSDRHGIYDTFINLPAAGRDNPVELFSVPLTALTVGTTTFRVQAGTGVANLDADFLVAPSSGGDPLVGGIYTVAFVNLEVTASVIEGPPLSIASVPLADGRTKVTLSYPVTAGRNYFVEFKDNLSSGLTWQTLAGGPFNLGTVANTNTLRQRFYRLRVEN